MARRYVSVERLWWCCAKTSGMLPCGALTRLHQPVTATAIPTAVSTIRLHQPCPLQEHYRITKQKETMQVANMKPIYIITYLYIYIHIYIYTNGPFQFLRVQVHTLKRFVLISSGRVNYRTGRFKLRGARPNIRTARSKLVGVGQQV